ncbi:MAG: penicillin-binding protein 2 [Enterobacterales bacterium]|nr:penicillin-binding protein 2 [Enterobacterales bacterium]
MKNHIHETNLYRNRTVIVGLMVLVMLAVLLTRVAYLQVIKHQDYQTLSNQNRIKLEPLPPNRGLLYDRNGVILANNRSVYSLELIPERVENMEQTLLTIQQLMPKVSDEHIDEFKESLKGARRFQSLSLFSGLDDFDKARIAVNQHRLPGVSIEARIQRYYPFGENMVHMLGYVGRINNRELAKIDTDNYRGTRHIGKVGLEKFYEDELHGEIGYQEVETDVRGRVLRVLNRKNPIPGRDIQLHIDSRLQLEAQRLLGNRRGVIVAVDPRDGGVMALVSTPGYDPNPFVSGISSKAYKALLDSPDRPLFNRALRGQYSPGSTIKPMLGLLALEEGTVTKDTRMWDPGFFKIKEEDQHRYRDWDRDGHGWVNMFSSIRDSCDTYFYNLALNLGIDKISEGMRTFGFGEYTDIDMGEELPGIMPDRGWKQANHNMRWFPGETVIVGIGQGYWTSTPLQLVSATAAIANNGIVYPLSIARGIGSGENMQLIDRRSEATTIFPFKDSNMKLIQDAMRAVNQFKGTAFTAFRGAKFSSAGKSGTVQLASIGQEDEYEEELVAERLRDNALFVAYAPFEKPEIAVAVVVENAGGGSTNAGPLARQMLEYFLSLEDPS